MESPSVPSEPLDISRPRRAMTTPAPPIASPQQAGPSASSPSSSPRPATAESDELVETLYSHPSVRIISFTSSQRGFTMSLPARSDKDDRPGSLPPSSRLERTIAAGAFRIYRAPGSVAFLSCGSALQPILPKSQCWCIDEGNSRFVLQIRRPQYWRIELPVDHPDDVHRAVLLRDVFDRILLFEKTQCPFERSFTVELDPETPIKKKAWTAEGKNLLSSPFQSDLSPPAHMPMSISRGEWAANLARNMSPGGEASWGDIDLSFGQAIPSDSETHLVADVPRTIGPVRSFAPSSSDDDRSAGAPERKAENSSTWSGSNTRETPSPPSLGSSWATSPEGLQLPEMPSPNPKDDDVLEPDHSSSENSPASFEGSGRVAPVNLARKRMSRVLAGRSFSATPPLAQTASPKSNEVGAVKGTRPRSSLARIQSPGTSTDTFHSAQSWQSSITEATAKPRSGDSLSKARRASLPESPSLAPFSSDKNATSKTTAEAIPSPLVSDSSGSEEPSPQSGEVVTDKSPEESIGSENGSGVSQLPTLEDKIPVNRRRSHTCNLSISHRGLSPLPPAANFFTPPPRQTPQSRLAAVRRLSAAILYKTMELLLGPPSYLVKLMLHVAAKIMAGEWRGLVLGFGEAGERIPVQWDYYSDGELSDLSDSDDHVGITQGPSYSSDAPRAGMRRRSKWANDDDHDASSVD